MYGVEPHIAQRCTAQTLLNAHMHKHAGMSVFHSNNRRNAKLSDYTDTDDSNVCIYSIIGNRKS